MKNLIVIFATMLFVSCEVAVEKEATPVITETPAQAPVVPEKPKNIMPNENLEFTTDVFYLTRGGMNYMIIINDHRGGVEAINLTIDSLRAQWFINESNKNK